MQSWFLIIAESSSSTAWRVALAILLIALAIGVLWVLYRLGMALIKVEKLFGDLDEEVMPIIDKAETTIDEVNQELDKVNDITENVAHMTARIDSATRVVEQALSKPAKKAASFTSGVSQSVSSFFGRTPADEADTFAAEPVAEPSAAGDDEPSRTAGEEPEGSGFREGDPAGPAPEAAPADEADSPPKDEPTP